MICNDQKRAVSGRTYTITASIGDCLVSVKAAAAARLLTATYSTFPLESEHVLSLYADSERKRKYELPSVL